LLWFKYQDIYFILNRVTFISSIKNPITSYFPCTLYTPVAFVLWNSSFSHCFRGFQKIGEVPIQRWAISWYFVISELDWNYQWTYFTAPGLLPFLVSHTCHIGLFLTGSLKSANPQPILRILIMPISHVEEVQPWGTKLQVFFLLEIW